MSVKRYIHLIIKTHDRDNYRITRELRLEGTSGDCLVQALLKQRQLQQVIQRYAQLSLEFLQG